MTVIEAMVPIASQSFAQKAPNDGMTTSRSPNSTRVRSTVRRNRGSTRGGWGVLRFAAPVSEGPGGGTWVMNIGCMKRMSGRVRTTTSYATRDLCMSWPHSQILRRYADMGYMGMASAMTGDTGSRGWMSKPARSRPRMLAFNSRRSTEAS